MNRPAPKRRLPGIHLHKRLQNLSGHIFSRLDCASNSFFRKSCRRESRGPRTVASRAPALLHGLSARLARMWVFWRKAVLLRSARAMSYCRSKWSVSSREIKLRLGADRSRAIPLLLDCDGLQFEMAAAQERCRSDEFPRRKVLGREVALVNRIEFVEERQVRASDLHVH